MSQVITYSRFWQRRDTALAWSIANPILHEGEIGIEQDPGSSPGESRMKVGDGITAWNDLDYFGEGSLADGDKGDITVTGSGSTWTIDPGAVTLAKFQDIGTFELLARQAAGMGPPQRIAVGGSLNMIGGTLGLAGMTGDVTSSFDNTATTLATAQPAVHTWALAQTFTVAPIFTDQSGSRTALGATTLGANLFTFANPSAIRFIRINADNSVTARTASDFVTDLGIATLSDGDKGDITVSSSGTVWTIDTAQPNAHTWAATQTFTLAPVFTDASGSRTALGATTVGGNFFTLANPGAITFPRIDAANTVTARSAANYRTDLGLGTGDTPTFAGVVVDAGTLRINRSGDAASGQLLIDVDSGSTGQVVFRTGASNRIVFNKTSTAESGSNVGSNLAIAFYEDDGSTVRTVVTGNRASGVFDFAEAITFPAGKKLALGDGGTGAELADPGADRIMFWDDSAGAVDWLTAGTGLSISGTTLSASTAGLLSYVGSATVAGAAATTLAISGLSLDVDGVYLVRVDLTNASASTATLSLFVNADTTATNYDVQAMQLSNNTFANARVNAATIAAMAATASGGSTLGWLWITRGIRGYVKAIWHADEDSTTAIKIREATWAWRTLATNVTGITWSSSVASSLGIGSSIKVWKIT